MFFLLNMTKKRRCLSMLPGYFPPRKRHINEINSIFQMNCSCEINFPKSKNISHQCIESHKQTAFRSTAENFSISTQRVHCQRKIVFCNLQRYTDSIKLTFMHPSKPSFLSKPFNDNFKNFNSTLSLFHLFLDKPTLKYCNFSFR